MIIFHKTKDLQHWASKNTSKWQKCGFVPTMGALHAGHISLIGQSKESTPLTIASIFVNPSQFNDPADFAKYPVTIDTDIRALETAGCDILFLPDGSEIYPDGWHNGKHYALGSLESLLEGFYRPGHFQGVCQVVHRLLDIVRPAALFMGQKDFQQCMVVSRLIELENMTVKLQTCPTLRETDGLAMSSRNMRLTPDQRTRATAIFHELSVIRKEISKYPLRDLEKRACERLLISGFSKVDYVSITNPVTLEPLAKWEEGTAAVVLAAAFMGEVRLIDNLLV